MEKYTTYFAMESPIQIRLSFSNECWKTANKLQNEHEQAKQQTFIWIHSWAYGEEQAVWTIKTQASTSKNTSL